MNYSQNILRNLLFMFHTILSQLIHNTICKNDSTVANFFISSYHNTISTHQMDSKIINRRLSAPSASTNNSGENHKLTGKDNQLALSTNDHLTIEKEFSSSKKGLKWISSKSNFEKYVNKAYFLQINLVFTKGIDHQINNYNLQHFLEYDFSILISIESKEVKNQTNFFWRIQGLDIIYCLEITNDLVSNYCQNLLIKEVRNCRTGNQIIQKCHF